jgi:hypothetical protein
VGYWILVLIFPHPSSLIPLSDIYLFTTSPCLHYTISCCRGGVISGAFYPGNTMVTQLRLNIIQRQNNTLSIQIQTKADKLAKILKKKFKNQIRPSPGEKHG